MKQDGVNVIVAPRFEGNEAGRADDRVQHVAEIVTDHPQELIPRLQDVIGLRTFAQEVLVRFAALDR